MSIVIRMTMFKKIHLPTTPVRVEMLDNDRLALSFTERDRPDIVCSRADLPSWFVGKLSFLEERVSEFEPCEYGSRMSDNVFYVRCDNM
jgi:hypothetical protein